MSPGDLLDDFRTQERTAFVSDDGAISFAQNTYQATAYVVGNFATGSVEHKLVAGVDYAYEIGFSPAASFEREIASIDIFNPVYNPSLGAVLTRFNRDKSRSESLGFYVQDQINFSDNFILLLGGRYDIVDQGNEDLETGTSTSQEDGAFSPRIGLVYKPTETVSLYGSFSRSFEQVTGNTFDNELFESQRGTQYEVGIKANFLDDRLSGTLAFYDLTLSNVLTLDPRDPDFNIQTGKQRSQGIELDVAGEILPGWEIIAAYSYTDARVTEDNVIPEGNQLVNAPEHAFSLWTKYEIQRGDLQGLGFSLGLFYIGERAGDLDNSFELPSYLRTDAAIYYRRNNFRAALNINNLFDIDYFEDADARNRIFPGAPLTVLGTVSVEF